MTQRINTSYCWKEHFSLSPENVISLEGKPFFFKLLLAISYQEKYRWSHLLRTPPLHISEMDVLMVQRLEMLLVGSSVLCRLSGNDLERKRTLLWEGVLQREIIYFQQNLLAFLPSIKILLGWQNFWKRRMPWRMFSLSETGQATNTLAVPSFSWILLPVLGTWKWISSIHLILQHREDWHLWTANSAQEAQHGLTPIYMDLNKVINDYSQHQFLGL